MTSESETLERVERLRKFDLFSDWIHDPASSEAFQFLATCMVERAFSPQTPILREGEMGTELYLLTHGTVEIYKRTPDGEPFKVARVSEGPSAFFGEGALLDTEARSATVMATQSVRCLVLSRAAFHLFSEKHPSWAIPLLSRIARGVLRRLRKSNEDLLLLYRALLDEVRGS